MCGMSVVLHAHAEHAELSSEEPTNIGDGRSSGLKKPHTYAERTSTAGSKRHTKKLEISLNQRISKLRRHRMLHVSVAWFL